MYKRPIFAILLGLTFAFPSQGRADEKAAQNDKPAVLLRFASLDQLRSGFRYLADVVGQGEKAKQLDGIIQAKLGDKGLEAIDAKKPFGIYGWVGAGVIDSKVVLLVPIADKKALLDLFEKTLDFKTEKDKDDVYKMMVDYSPYPIYFRFANEYAYLTIRDKEVLDKDKLLAPSVVLPQGQVGAVSLTLNVDEIPNDLKQTAFGAIENQLADLKEKEMGSHTEAQKKFRDAAIDELGARLKSLFNHGGATTLRVDLDQKSGDLALTATVAGKPGSPLANTIRDLGQVKSFTAALVRSDSALKGELNVSLPEKLRTLLGPALADAEKHILSHTKDNHEREVIGSLVKAVMPTLKAAELDAAFDLRGPSDKGLYTILGGIKIKDGANLEKTFRKNAPKFPDTIQVDVEKSAQVNIHRINPDKDLDPGARRAIGDNPVYIAFREDVLLFSAGDNGLRALKEALTVAPTTGKLIELQLVLARLIALSDDPASADIARKVFADDKEGSRLSLTLEGGKALTLRLSLKAKVIDYLNRVEKAKKE